MLESYSFLFEIFKFKEGLPLYIPIVLGIIMALLLIASAIIDYKHFIIPDLITIPATITSAMLSFLLFEKPVVHIVIGILVFLFYFVLSFVKIRGNYAIGMGDAKIYAWLGMSFAQAVFPIIFLAAIIGAVQAALTSLSKSIKDVRFAHGPHIVLATFVVVALAIFVS